MKWGLRCFLLEEICLIIRLWNIKTFSDQVFFFYWLYFHIFFKFISNRAVHHIRHIVWQDIEEKQGYTYIGLEIYLHDLNQIQILHVMQWQRYIFNNRFIAINVFVPNHLYLHSITTKSVYFDRIVKRLACVRTISWSALLLLTLRHGSNADRGSIF